MAVLSFRRVGAEMAVSEIASAFFKGDPVVIPTDTLYGLAAPVSDRDTVERIFRIKNRPISMTLPIAVGDISMLLAICEADGWRLERIRELLPGPYTFVLRAKESSDPLIVRDGTVAVRIPDHPLYSILTREVGPVALTSANPHGGPSIVRAEELDRLYSGKILVLEDDERISGAASEIVDLTGELPTVLRSGSLNKRRALEGS
jgi:L-threonylcarbamoyladenylate synthase